MLMTISAITTILYSTNIKVIASEEGSNRVGLDYDFMWNVTENLSNIINTSYHGNVIRMGRAFGTNGEHDAATFINYTMNTGVGHNYSFTT